MVRAASVGFPRSLDKIEALFLVTETILWASPRGLRVKLWCICSLPQIINTEIDYLTIGASVGTLAASLLFLLVRRISVWGGIWFDEMYTGTSRSEAMRPDCCYALTSQQFCKQLPWSVSLVGHLRLLTEPAGYDMVSIHVMHWLWVVIGKWNQLKRNTGYLEGKFCTTWHGRT